MDACSSAARTDHNTFQLIQFIFALPARPSAQPVRLTLLDELIEALLNRTFTPDKVDSQSRRILSVDEQRKRLRHILPLSMSFSIMNKS